MSAFDFKTAPLPYLGKTFAEQDECVLLAQQILGEARNQKWIAKIGCGCVTRNRVGYQGKYGKGFRGVILKPYAFDCFLPNDPNHHMLMEPTRYTHPEVWNECYEAARQVYFGEATDPTDGSTFYYSLPLTGPPKKHDGTSAWGPVIHAVDLDGLHFYREFRGPFGKPSVYVA